MEETTKMGLFSGIKKQLLKVIQWEDQSRNTLVQKFQYDDRYAIMKGSQLIVRPSQAAIFVYQGSVCDVFTEGIWKLEEGSTPILTKLANWNTLLKIQSKLTCTLSIFVNSLK